MNYIADSLFGTIESPEFLSSYGGGEGGGLIMFINNLLQFAIVIGGLIVLFNVVMAGFTYLTAGSDSKASEKVVSSLTNSLWGIALMVLAPALMAVVGFLFFGDSTFFLNPSLGGVGGN